MCNSCICNICDLIVSTILGIVLAVLVFFFSITGITTGLWIILSLGLGILILTSFLISSYRNNICACRNARCLIISTLGTIIAATIAISISSIVPGLLSIAILFFFVGLFSILMLSSLARLLICLACCNS